MKRLIYLLLLLCTTLVNAQVADTFNQSKQLKSLFAKGFVHKGKDSLVYQKLFFDKFPANFSSFDALFGYDDVKGAAPLYNEANQYIDKLFFTKAANAKQKARKFIGIAMNGQWDADAISHFQHQLQDFTVSNFATFLKELNKLKSKEEIESVWQFCFDVESSGYRKRYYETLHDKLGKNQPMIDILYSAYKKASSKQIH
ncbi:hypothetical protein [Mucilaginibacter terrae]|uniref:Uncharacterized protein n=1 Tax=Mucilaginibacter terrae TaxID=1955052 RepID=A0ABU3GT75_9SPHI|nr:hypothetical protein [Mucilaginibacter terrae]MDT3402761.1 hypothetical protein [Mucilaginibacter terrae]